MKTAEDKKLQAQTEMDAAIAKRFRAKKLWAEAEEELIMARMKMQDALAEEALMKKQILRGLINGEEIRK